MLRRTVLLGFMVAPLAHAQAPATPATKLFPYLKGYWRLPAAERTHFKPAYIIRARNVAQADVHVYLTVAGVRREIALAPDGHVLTLPSAADLDGTVTSNQSQKDITVSIRARPVLTLASTMATGDVALALSQGKRGIRKIAGPLGVLVPAREGVAFETASGEAAWPDGKRVALPIVDGSAIFHPAAQAFRGATQLVFPAAPLSAKFVE